MFSQSVISAMTHSEYIHKWIKPSKWAEDRGGAASTLIGSERTPSLACVVLFREQMGVIMAGLVRERHQTQIIPSPPTPTHTSGRRSQALDTVDLSN